MAKYGELFLKSESVQRFYTKLLTKNIRGVLDAEGINAEIVLHRGRILIGDSAKGDDVNAIAAAVSRVYGIVGLSIAEMTGNDFVRLDERADVQQGPRRYPVQRQGPSAQRQQAVR